MRFGICTDLLHLQEVAAAGFDYIEPKVYDLALCSEAEFAAIQRELAGSPIPCEAANFFYPTDFRVVGEGIDLPRIYDYIDRAVERLGALGVRMVTVGSSGPRRIPEGFPREQAARQFADQLRRIGQGAARFPGMTVAIEPIRPASTNFINTIAEGVALCQAVGLPNVRVMADYNQMRGAGDPIASITQYGSWLCHLHTIDVEHSNVYPYDPADAGQRALFAAYRAVCPTGRASIEGAPFTDLATARRALQALQAYAASREEACRDAGAENADHHH